MACILRPAAVTVKSPCLLVCELDRTTGWCFGCGRTGEEVENWLAYSDGRRDAVMAALPARLVTRWACRPKATSG